MPDASASVQYSAGLGYRATFDRGTGPDRGAGPERRAGPGRRAGPDYLAQNPVRDRVVSAAALGQPVRATGIRITYRYSRALFLRLAERRVFPGHETELRQVRRWLSGLLPDVPARDDVIVVAVELATNAIRHTASVHGGSFAVEINWPAQSATMRVAVSDDGAPTGTRDIAVDPLSEHGGGLQVVRNLASGIGARGDHCGRLMCGLTSTS